MSIVLTGIPLKMHTGVQSVIHDRLMECGQQTLRTMVAEAIHPENSNPDLTFLY